MCGRGDVTSLKLEHNLHIRARTDPITIAGPCIDLHTRLFNRRYRIVVMWIHTEYLPRATSPILYPCPFRKIVNHQYDYSYRCTKKIQLKLCDSLFAIEWS